MIKDIQEGKMNGYYVWICDYRFSNKNDDKPLRHVKPTRVLIRDNKELPKTKRIYYSESHFVELKNGVPVNSKIHSLFDNTGYRLMTGTPVFVSLDEITCREYYQKQVKEIIENLNIYIEQKIKFRDELEKNIN